MGRATPATRVLDALGIPYEVHTYRYEAGRDIGARAAEALGIVPEILLKTLMVLVDDVARCVVTPSDGEISMKAVARGFSGKFARMMDVADAQKSTGYVVGGISPLGQRKRIRTLINSRAMVFDAVYCNAGLRGVQVKLSPENLVWACEAEIVVLD